MSIENDDKYIHTIKCKKLLVIKSLLNNTFNRNIVSKEDDYSSINKKHYKYIVNDTNDNKSLNLKQVSTINIINNKNKDKIKKYNYSDKSSLYNKRILEEKYRHLMNMLKENNFNN